MKRLLIPAIAILASASSVQAVYHEPFERSRVYWDASTRRTPLPAWSAYGRLIELNDGRLVMMGATNGGIHAVFSSDFGDTWTSPRLVVTNPKGYGLANPDFYQMSDGTFLLGVNPRPNTPYSEDRPFTIEVYRSMDNGTTWSDPIRIFAAKHTGGDGCWEPAFLELPSGELQCYFSVELINSGDQEIMMSRSFDKGLTWSEAIRVSYRSGHRDGMATPILTDNNEIVYTIEDNGQPGYNGFRATSIRTTLENNWSDGWVNGSSSRRAKCLINADDLKYISAGPYLRKLPNGETIISWMGEKEGIVGKGIDYFKHFVAVGDADARNFRCTNTSFYVPDDGRANWGSINLDNHGHVYAVAETYNGGQTQGNSVIRGTVRKGFEAAYGTPALDANPKKDPYAYTLGRQLTMGSQTGNRLEMDFLYDENNLYFYLYAADGEILPDEPIDKDGVFLWLDVPGLSDTHPQEGIFKFFFNVNGEVTLREGLNNKWQAEQTVTDKVRLKKHVGNTYYRMEAAIPWSLLGLESAPKDGRVMRINVQQRDRRAKKLLIEKIPETTDKASWTWPEFRLLPNPDSSIETPEGDFTATDDAPVEYYNLQGQRLTEAARGINIRRQGTKVEKILSL